MSSQKLFMPSAKELLRSVVKGDHILEHPVEDNCYEPAYFAPVSQSRLCYGVVKRRPAHKRRIEDATRHHQAAAQAAVTETQAAAKRRRINSTSAALRKHNTAINQNPQVGLQASLQAFLHSGYNIINSCGLVFWANVEACRSDCDAHRQEQQMLLVQSSI